MPKRDLVLRTPLLNAAGTLGFTPDLRGPLDWERLGAFITNPISAASRSPAGGKRLLAYPGGALLHTGHPNPGFRAVLRRYGKRWAAAPLPIIPHLLAEGPKELRGMVERLEEAENVLGVELGLQDDIDPQAAAELIRAAAGELAVIARVPPGRAVDLAETSIEAGASAVSLAPLRGALPDEAVGMVTGRLYGPAMFPQALEAVRTLGGMGIPVIGAGGVYKQEQAEAMLAAGATAVQVDAVLWRGGWPQTSLA